MELCAVRDCTTVSHDRLSRAPDPRAEMAQGRRNFAFEQISAKVRASSHHLPPLGRTGALRKALCGSAEKLRVTPPQPVLHLTPCSRALRKHAVRSYEAIERSRPP